MKYNTITILIINVRSLTFMARLSKISYKAYVRLRRATHKGWGGLYTITDPSYWLRG